MSDELRMLVVDDNEEFCQNVADIMELKGYTVATAYDGFKALELVKQDGFSVVLMDVKMPGMDGVETFRKIKEAAPGTSVIMVTAYAVEELLAEALREGAFGFLRKPLDFDRLFKVVTQAIPNGELILVVDDDENLCANVKDVLIDKGYRVSVAHDGNTALEKAQEKNFDIMLIDLKLNALNGLETYRFIRDFRPDVVVIIITGYPQEMATLAQQALQENAYTCLEKPINMDELVSLLERIKQEKDTGTFNKPG
jgi:DNA-binding NtrC family response regulator